MALFAFTFNSVAQEEPWIWKDRDGNIRTRAEFDKILADHGTWIFTNGTRGVKADLSGADLSTANLSDVVLILTNLSDTDLRGVNLSGASLMGADLSGANLSGADLSGAHLDGALLLDADLSDAIMADASLMGVELSSMDLSDADLSGAGLVFAILSGADLSGADLSGADLMFADLDRAFYEPAKPPSTESIAQARNLDRLTYRDDPSQITALKQALRVAGFHEQHRRVVAAIRRHDASWVETAFFDWTCEFGANATRPLWIVAGIWFICTVFYWLLLHRKKGSGLYLLASGKKVNTGNEWMFVQRLQYRHPPRIKWYKFLFPVLRREGHALGTAVLFSFMSAFNIGFRELNFGRWIRMLQPREFDIKAHGIARVISGAQSLLSIGLVVLAILSYFGTPFDR